MATCIFIHDKIKMNRKKFKNQIQVEIFKVRKKKLKGRWENKYI